MKKITKEMILEDAKKITSNIFVYNLQICLEL